MALKPKRKALYLKISTSLGLYRDIVWHASSHYEAEDIRRALQLSDHATIIVTNPLSIEANAHSSCSLTKILVASDTPGVVWFSPYGGRFRSKTPGQLDVVFLSRIARMKNLDGALWYLRGLHGQVRFDIYGPIEDAAYWEQCRRLIAQLPANVQVSYCGEVPHEAVLSTLASYHLFLLPTRGENFGHVIHEALSAGCPVLISDRTPWRDLERLGVGWDLPLEEPERFCAILQRCVDMDA
ncbi:MAG: glycosyltransferase, partial [Candidatus Methanomethylicaceae archaeon]